MQKTTTLLITLLLSCIIVDVMAQGHDTASEPKFNFGNAFQGAGGLDSANLNAVLAFEKVQERADQHYKAKRYKQAFKDYHDLAKFNDKYSQYRVAFMYATARGVEKNMPAAYAWSYVASETRQKGFVNYHVKLREQLVPTQMDHGKELASEYLREYGTYSIANQARGLLRKGKRNCTGSRLGSSCDKVSSAGFNCGATSEGIPGKECMILGAIGLPAIAGLQPVDLRKAENQLEQLIDIYNPGKVELGELEIIED